MWAVWHPPAGATDVAAAEAQASHPAKHNADKAGNIMVSIISRALYGDNFGRR